MKIKKMINGKKTGSELSSFTLIEVLVAIWILGTSLVALIGLYIGNIKFSQKIDEITTALFISFDVPYKKYLEEKYRIEIPPREIPENYKVEEDILDFSSLATGIAPIASFIKVPPFPKVKISTPSKVSIEILGKMKTTITTMPQQ